MNRPIVVLCTALGLTAAAVAMGDEVAYNGGSMLTDIAAWQGTLMLSVAAGLLPKAIHGFLGSPDLTMPKIQLPEITAVEQVRRVSPKPIVLAPRYGYAFPA